MVRDLENRIKLRRLLFEHEKQMREQQLRESLDDSYQQNEEQEKSFDSIQVPSGSAFTEGGVVYTSESDENTPSLFDNFMGFTRHERLDVKKPGPQPPNPYKSDDNIIPSRPKINSTELKVKKLVHDMKDDHANFSVDNEFAHVILKNSLDSWSDGERIVQALGEMLNLQNYLTHIRVDRQEVTFKVEQNPERKTAFDVAKAINDGRFKNNLSRRMGVLVMRAGVGDKVKDYENEWKNTKIEALSEDMNMKMIIIVMIIISTALAIVICLGVLILYKRIMRRREKYNNLHCNLTKADSSSKDYQELCRARMASKNEVSTTRMASLSKENDKPPSSRSSTSSWSEEPAGFNMDISTGHMVLSYMEDHLKNKGRLQREWEALCRYEAEPNSREAALHEDTICFNRSESAVPYDHSRVVLNHLANANGIDYINASTIVSFFLS
jgi:receptor-type tyrosine-protein phosphatase N